MYLYIHYCRLPCSVRVSKRCVGRHRDSVGSTEIDQFFVREVRMDLDLIQKMYDLFSLIIFTCVPYPIKFIIYITSMCILGLWGIILYQITKTPYACNTYKNISTTLEDLITNWNNCMCLCGIILILEPFE